MSGKVIHISEAIHNKANTYCKKHDIYMSIWVEALINKELSKLDKKISDEIAAEIVQKNKIIINTMTISTEDPWARPAFWDTNESSVNT